MNDYAIELLSINKSFGRVPVLKDVDFKLRKGSIHALVGGNGAGKSTLMKILTGVYVKDSGTCKVNGKEVVIHNYNEARREGISLIFQELSLIPTLDVTDNIFLNKEIKKGGLLDYKTMNQRAIQLMKKLEIELDVNEKIKNLGVGSCQLVEIAKALSDDTSVIVMDEPTASLSDKEIAILFKIIKQLKARGISIVYISHRMNEIFQIADEISVLYSGKVVASKPTQEFTLNSLIESMLGGKKNEESMKWKERKTQIGIHNVLEVKNLYIDDIIKNVSFVVKQSEIVGLAGLMGSGRTEILETIFGLRKKKSGTILMENKEINNVKQAINNKIALIPEDRRRSGLVLMHSLCDNIIITNLDKVRKYGFIKNKKVKKISNEAIDNLNIKSDGIKIKTSLLSGGNQQKVVISKWLATSPKLIILDEPTSGVDIHAKTEILEILRNYADEGNSVLFVSSELSEMIAICDRIIVLKDGEATGELTHKDIKNEEVLHYAIQKEKSN
ncbi:sugar ABC transporter ATP-binding protein [Sphaerochaeta halotolerans]|uniref:Sugar ABC transporter ATP-binding protein n=1 Tax=Sphaerochaeta halotolerans TaxID=2293840 RepID=A0A372MIA3_9SPIR|nr:sugar ABC transporter ATP-binding protein [Sphaerochaeta halotolerans]RFU95056.1 sugar ABC transporter ATP-binding protein [Sphaerochaeta halotolerans]